MIKNYLEKVMVGESLAFDEAYNIMHSIMSGEENNSKIASLLTVKNKGRNI